MNIASLALNLIAALKALYPTGSIDNSLLASKEGMAFAAELHPQCFPGRASGEGVATGASNSGIRIVFGMNFFSHTYSE